MSNNIAWGDMAEQAAGAYLKEKGYTILEKKYRTPQAEIDIIAKLDTYVVFVEVKYRASLKYGYPREAVGFRKQRKIRSAALYYIAGRQLSDTDFRFDVIEMLGRENPVINHIENAF